MIMVLGYVSMHLTFVSLFLSMRRLGSNFWLATSVLFSSVFSFLFGLYVTVRLGVPINMVLLSEGLPFLVVTIGFEKAIILTKAVLSASMDTRRNNVAAGDINRTAAPPIQHALEIAVKQTGFEIVRDYAIEIAILAAGAASGVQGGLRQFCFLAAWILAFDCVLLFTFYTAILCIKLEINRIKRHVAIRKALEDDGVNRRVAENVAANNEIDGGLAGGDAAHDVAVFGKKVRASSVPKFKILMVGGFILVNAINLGTIPFRSTNTNASPPTTSGLANPLSPTPIDPFRVAENGLDTIFNSAKKNKIETIVTVLPPIKYEMQNPASTYSGLKQRSSDYDMDYIDPFFDTMGGKVFESLFRSLEDPVMSKWIIAALTLSLMLNGYLFNAARWSVKESQILEKAMVGDAPGNQQDGQAVPPTQNPPPADAIPPEVDLELEAAEKQVDDSKPRTRAECEQMLVDKKAPHLTDEELVDLSLRGKIPGHALEKTLTNEKVMSRLASLTRAVKIRRSVISRTPVTQELTSVLEASKLPYKNFNYGLVHGACCENVIGYLPLPVGLAGPLVVDGTSYFIPMATTEGVLVASTSRGCKAINAGGGAITVVTGDGMTRGPCVSFPTLTRAGAAKIWLDSEEGQKVMSKAFNSTSRFARLQNMKTALAGTNLYIRFKTTTGDAMGMNMISKGVEHALKVMSQESGFEDMSIVSVSGNYCIDKKPAAVNWIDGRGKAVVAEAIIPGEVVEKVLKSSVDALVELNISKNLIGSAMAGSIGGFNAHASNIVTAMFLATGQDPAQNVESSNCITIMKK